MARSSNTRSTAIDAADIVTLRAADTDRGALLMAASVCAYRLVRVESRSAASVARASRLSQPTIGRYVALAPVVESVTRHMGADTDGLADLWTAVARSSSPVAMLETVAGMAPVSYADARTALVALEPVAAPVADAPVSGPSDGSGTAGSLTDAPADSGTDAADTDPGADAPADTDPADAYAKSVRAMAARLVTLATDTDGRIPSADTLATVAADILRAADALVWETVATETRKRADAADRAAVVAADLERKRAKVAEAAARVGMTVAA